jgi:hypothetical protein
MSTKLSRAASIFLAAAVLGGTSLPSQAAPSRSAAAYDGEWSVVIQTTRGDCPAAIRAGVRILAGRVLAEDQNYAVAGRVAANGAVRVNVAAGGQSAGGFGRLSRNVGRGLWRTRSGECAGQWTAARRE